MARGLVHHDAVSIVGPGERVRDPEGRWKNLGAPVVLPDALVRHAGSGEREVQMGNRKTVRVDVVVLAPLGTSIRQGWKIEVEGVSADLDDSYRVVQVKNVVKHLRILGTLQDV